MQMKNVFKKLRLNYPDTNSLQFRCFCNASGTVFKCQKQTAEADWRSNNKYLIPNRWDRGLSCASLLAIIKNNSLVLFLWLTSFFLFVPPFYQVFKIKRSKVQCSAVLKQWSKNNDLEKISMLRKNFIRLLILNKLYLKLLHSKYQQIQ